MLPFLGIPTTRQALVRQPGTAAASLDWKPPRVPQTDNPPRFSGLGQWAKAAAQWMKPAKTDEIQPTAKANPDFLRMHVRALSAMDRRHVFYPAHQVKAARYISLVWQGLGLPVRQQTFVIPPEHTPFKQPTAHQNVLTAFGPENAPRIVIGAHYDVDAVQYRHHGLYPGADDNASGVAGLLELARMLKAEPELEKKLTRRIELVAFTNEENPYFGTQYMGSMVHAKSLKDAGTPVDAMIAMDVIGYFSDQPGSQYLPGLTRLKPKGDFVGLAGDLNSAALTKQLKKSFTTHTQLPVKAINLPATVMGKRTGVDTSDHWSYSQQGWPAVVIGDTGPRRNPNIHTRFDTWDTLNYDKMAQVVQAVHGFLVNYATR